MLGLKELKGECQCGDIKNHEFVVGKEKSKASGRYPGELCDKYAKLAISQLDLMAKEEFLSHQEGEIAKGYRRAQEQVGERRVKLHIKLDGGNFDKQP